MQSMSEDDMAYSALLVQLFSDSTTRNVRISLTEQQYDFEHFIDRPDSPILPRSRSLASPCPSYDSLFSPRHPATDDLEECDHAPRIVKEMAHGKLQSQLHPYDKPLPVLPHDSSRAHSSLPFALRSSSSSKRICYLPPPISRDQSPSQGVLPHFPVPVIGSAKYRYDPVLRFNNYSHKCNNPLVRDPSYLCPFPDEKDSFQPFPTLSDFSFPYSCETSITLQYTSLPASSSDVAFFPCSPESISPPASLAKKDKSFLRRSAQDRFSLFQGLRSLITLSPKTGVFPTSPDFPLANSVDGTAHFLPTSKLATHSQSCCSVTTATSLITSTVECSERLDAKKPLKDKDTNSQAPKKRHRFIGFVSRLFPRRNNHLPSIQAGGNVECHSANGGDNNNDKEKKTRKLLRKKPSHSLLRSSFSLSRVFNPQEPVLVS